MSSDQVQFAFVGGLRQDYCITHAGRVVENALGGNAVYASVGARLWSDSIGIVSRVGSNFPKEWLQQLEFHGIQTSGVHISSEAQDTRTFYVYLTPEERIDTNPAAHFLRIEHPLPKGLIDYRSSTERQDDRFTFGPLAVRPDDLPHAILAADAAHLAPADYLTHTTVQLKLRELGISPITLDPSERYMEPRFRKHLPVIISGLDAFLPSEAESRAFFRPADMDLWEMAEAFGAMGARLVVIKCGPRGQILWDRDSRERWRIPAYPAEVRDVTGAGDAFCGGFLVGLHETGDPVEAALRGSVSASLVIEGTGALYALEALPGLLHARLDALRPLVRAV